MTTQTFYFIGEHAVSPLVYSLTGAAQVALLCLGALWICKLVRSVITAVQYDRSIARQRSRDAHVKRLSLDSYERAAWAEIAALNIGDPLDEELLATGRELPQQHGCALPRFFVTDPRYVAEVPIPRMIGTHTISTGLLRDSFKDLAHVELPVMTPELFDYARHRNVSVSWLAKIDSTSREQRVVTRIRYDQ